MSDLIGKRFGQLTVLKRMVSNKWRQFCWLCRCDCGKEKIIIGYNLKSGTTKSCGCLHKEKTLCLSEWAEQTGISTDTIRWRLKHNWPVEKVLTTPVANQSGT